MKPSPAEKAEFEVFAKGEHLLLDPSPYPGNYRTYKYSRTQHMLEGWLGKARQNDPWIEFTYEGHRWSFNDSDLALWDEELEGFHFHSYHELVDPDVDAIREYMDKVGVKS